MRPVFPLLFVATFGCGAGPLGPDFTRALTRFGGCGDVIFFAVDSADEVMVTFRAEGLVAEAREVGDETSTSLDLPADGTELIVEQGSQISDAACDDVIENLGPRVQRTWRAVSGTATVTIRPSTDSTGGWGDLILEDVVFASGDEPSITVEHLEWQDVLVGWYPG